MGRLVAECAAAGTPIAQRHSSGQEYSYLFDGQGNVVGLEDPGTVAAAYDYCPTGNEADLVGAPPTRAALNNPLRQGAQVYDDDLSKLYVGPNGVLTPDYSGVGTQTAGIRFGDALAGGAGRFGTGRLVGPAGGLVSLAGSSQNCGGDNSEQSTADQQGCEILQQTSGAARADQSTGGESGGPGESITVPPRSPTNLQPGTTTPWDPREYQGWESRGRCRRPISRAG